MILLPKYDYCSPGLQTVDASEHFPNRIAGEPDQVGWQWMRKDDPHLWYCDARMPRAGFVNHDESMILYNLGRQFAGCRALEVGCLWGWSSWHLAAGGVTLDVVDPLPASHEVARRSLEYSLREYRGSVFVYPRESPQEVDRLGRTGLRWSLIFVDANHDAPYPVIDAAVCQHYAAQDAMIVFHDALSPDVFDAVRYLRSRGWKSRLLWTSQMMAMVWRGEVEPLKHIPDPAIAALPLPDHLSVWEDD